MDSSPSKRRKTSSTPAVPGDAPTTPSRIPVRAQPMSGRPSFASPTKASLSKHHPQLLRRSSSVGLGAERPTSRGRDIQDVFARALGETRPSIEGSKPLLAQANVSTTPRSSAHKRARSDGGGLSAKPRRMSKSPFKQNPKPPGQQRDAVEEMQENIDNPFVKRGLRRSPPAGSQNAVLQDLQEHDINPFAKRGLRRSPVSSQAVEAAGELLHQNRAVLDASIAAPDVLPSEAADDPEVGRLLARRGSEPYTTQSTEPITVNSFEQHEQPQLAQTPFEQASPPVLEESADVADPERERHQHLEQSPKRRPRSPQVAATAAHNRAQYEIPELPLKTTDPPRSPELDQPIILPRLQEPRERHLKESSKRPTHAVHAEELLNANRRKPEEPELPPTPTQLGIPDPIVTTPPSGIHDTPSRRAKKKSKQKSSPLKPRDPAPQVETDAQSRSKSETRQIISRRKSLRFVVPEDPYAAKKKTRDELLNEIRNLQADIALGNQENERLRLQNESRKKQRTNAPTNSDELLNMLHRATAPTLEPKVKPKSIFKSIDSFLPFRSRRKRPTSTIPALEKPVPSHLPVTLDEPLPYLQVFSPLVYTSTVSLLSQEQSLSDASAQERGLAHQIHRIKASHPSGLFAARLSMIVNSSLLSISSLDIDALPLSAEKELGTFMRERSNPDPILNRDIGVVFWAMGRWVEVSITRAKFWATVELDFTTPEARTKSLKRKVRKRKRRGSVVLGEDVTDNENDEDMKRKWTIKQLLPHMGRTAMEFSNHEVELRFEWKVGFDWTGEPESAISASAKLPKSWQNQDDRKSLQRIPILFDKLVKRNGPLLAVRTIVGLLMPTP